MYLSDHSKLSEDDHPLLKELGWEAPTADIDDPDAYPANWSLPLVHGDWTYLVQMFLATLVGVFGFCENREIQIDTFGCDRPCRDCSWPDDFHKHRATPGDTQL